MKKHDQQELAARLQRLFTGEYDGIASDRCADVLLLPGAGHDALRDLPLHSSTLVLAPRGDAPRKADVAGARVVKYDGGLGDLEDELVVEGGLAVRREGYTAAPFVPLTCPTVVSILGPDDHESFLADADAAVASGAFEEILLHPLTVLGDLCALGSEHACAAPERLRAVVDADGARPSLGGAAFAGELPATACTVCLGAVVAGAALEAARAPRPWLSRYLRALDVLRGLGGRVQGPVAVSGFGHRFVETVPGDPIEAADAPVLVHADGEHFICDPSSRRVLRSGRDAVRVMEVALADPGPDLVEAVARHLDLETHVASAAVEQLERVFDELSFPIRFREAA